MRLAVLAVVAISFLAGCAENANPTPNPTSPGNAVATTPATPGSAAASACKSTTSDKSAKEPVVTLETTMGAIRLTLFCDKAPVTTQHIVKLIEAGCWEGTRFHRVVKGFMNQGGDPLSKDETQQSRWGTGGPSDCGQSPSTIVEEFYCADGTVSTQTPSGGQQPTQCDARGGLGLRHSAAGVWSMARTSAPATSGSQFFLTAGAASFLDGRYTIFGGSADAASTDVILAINNLPCGGRACADPPQGSSRTDTPVLVSAATIAWG